MRIRQVLKLKRPEKAPEGWEIYNAPRPLYGSQENGKTKVWTGDFICGIFYAAVNPEDPEAEWIREENEKLDATRLKYVTRQQVIDEMVRYYERTYSPEKVKQIFAENPIDKEETRNMLIKTWYNLDFHWIEDLD